MSTALSSVIVSLGLGPVSRQVLREKIEKKGITQGNVSWADPLNADFRLGSFTFWFDQFAPGFAAGGLLGTDTDMWQDLAVLVPLA